MPYHEPVSDLSDEELFNAAERARRALHRSLKGPAGEYSPRRVQELRQTVVAYDTILLDRLRNALEMLS